MGEPQPDANEPPPSENGRDDGCDSIDGLFRAHNRALIAFLSTKVDTVADAHEIAQEAYVRMLRLERRDEIGFLRAYLFRIAANLAVDHQRAQSLRRQQQVQAHTEDLFSGWLTPPSVEHEAVASERMRRIRSALRNLPAATSRAFVMRIVEGREFPDIAASMGIAERTVRYHVTRALAYCSQHIMEKGEER